MGMYALSTTKLITDLKEAVPEVAQAWFADDASGVSRLTKLAYKNVVG